VTKLREVLFALTALVWGAGDAVALYAPDPTALGFLF
jgi:hypothetical protein